MAEHAAILSKRSRRLPYLSPSSSPQIVWGCSGGIIGRMSPRSLEATMAGSVSKMIWLCPLRRLAVAADLDRRHSAILK